jgi:hypothetical protein
MCKALLQDELDTYNMLSCYAVVSQTAGTDITSPDLSPVKQSQGANGLKETVQSQSPKRKSIARANNSAACLTLAQCCSPGCPSPRSRPHARPRISPQPPLSFAVKVCARDGSSVHSREKVPLGWDVDGNVYIKVGSKCSTRLIITHSIFNSLLLLHKPPTYTQQ